MVAEQKNSKNTIETLLIALFFLGLLYALFDVVKAFLGIFTFALIFSISFASLFEKLVRLLKGRRKLAAVIYAVLLIAIIAQPFLYMISSLSHHIKDISGVITDVKQNGLPPLAPQVSNMPFIGEPIADFYKQLQEEPKATLAVHEDQIKAILHGIVTKGAGVFGAASEIVLGIIVSAFLLQGGVKMITPVSNALKHILGKEDADALLTTSAMAIKGVSVGIMGTALIAAAFAWIGLMIAGIPFSLGIAALVFFLVIIQVGPLPVWIPLVIWLFVQGHTGWAIFMIIYGIALLAVDAIVKPLLISKSGKLPFLVLFLGVIGGMVAWGFTGMFKGAIIVAVFYTIFTNWLERKEGSESVVAE
ncbi:MAG: AI-2E family transporter [Chitinophagaceae bacterium]